jgi:hypothetical protein
LVNVACRCAAGRCGRQNDVGSLSLLSSLAGGQVFMVKLARQLSP